MIHSLKKMLSLALVSGLLLSSCVKTDFDEPDLPNPCDMQSGLTPNITVQGIGTLFASLPLVQGSTTVHQFPDSNIVLEAIVVSNDASGNIYKSLYLEDATGAVMLSIEGSDLYNDYPQGQKVHLNLANMTVEFDTWVSIHEIGYGTYVEGSVIKGIGRIPVTILPNLLKNHSCKTTPTPTVLDLAGINVANMGRLVTFNNVQIIAADTAKTYADAVSDPPASANIMLEDCNGTQIIMRNSGYALFAGLNVPNGKGSVTGILTKYGSDYQILLNDTSGVQLNGTRCGSGNGAGTGTGTFADPFDVEHATSDNTGTGVWVQGFIVGIIDVTTDPNNFVKDLSAPFLSNSNIYIAASATETDTTKMLIVQLPSGAIRTATNLVDNASLLGKEIKYHGDLMSYFSAKGMKNTDGYWLIEANTGIDPSIPADMVVKGTSQIVTSLNEQFNGGTAESPWELNGWLNANVQGERYWNFKTRDSNNYAQASAYGATATNIEEWLVSPGINCSVDKSFSFFVNVGYWKHNGLQVYVSTNFNGQASSLLTATWTDVTSSFTIPTAPTSGFGTLASAGTLDLSAYTGQIVYVLFKYTGDKTTNTTTYQIDNVVVTDL